MEANISNFDQIIHYIKIYHPTNDVEIKKVNSAYELLNELFKDSNDVPANFIGDINHSLEVAKLIASWRFDYTVVIAAILHIIPINNKESLLKLKSLMENSSYIILKSYLDIHSQMTSFETSCSSKNQYLDIDFILDTNPESFYIEIAKYIDILSQCIKNKNNQALSYAQITREFLIPQVKHINAYRIVDILEELCFQIENENIYKNISSIMEHVDCYNKFYRHQFVTELEHIFDKNSNIIPEKLKRFQPYIKSLCSSKRSLISIYRFITLNEPDLKQESTLQYDLDKLNNFYRTAYDDLTLVLEDRLISENIYSEIDIFMEYFETMLQPKGIFLYGFYHTNNRDSYYFLLSDPMKNMYRFFVQKETDYLHYLYGDIVSTDIFSLNYITKRTESKIKVFKMDGTSEMVEKGITVLDFAFKIHEELGLHFGGAILNRNNKLCPAHTILNNGDTIEIKKSDVITAELNWFRYLNTDLAINYLIKYFKNQFLTLKVNTSIDKESNKAVIEEN